MTFRLRLAVALAAFAVALSSIIGALTMSAARTAVDAEINRSLLATAGEFDQELNRELLRLAEARSSDGNAGGSGGGAQRSDRAEVFGSGTYVVRERLTDPSVVVQVFALDGSLVSGPVVRPEGIDSSIPIQEDVLSTIGDQRVLLVHRDVYTIVFTRGLKAREDFVNDLAQRSALTGGGGLVCALIISWLLARRLSRRLDDLARSARSAVNGSTVALDVDGADEIAALATAINTLVRSVKDAADHQQELFRYAGHELRTPLTAAMLNADILIRHHASLGAAEQLALLKTLREQLSGLERVSDEVADIASGAARTHVTEPLELLTEARSAGEVFSLAHQHHVIVEGDDVTVMADPQELKRVMENLLSNAVKYGGDEPVEMNVSRAGRVGVLTVRDHGSGFNEQETGALVEPFRRGRNVQSIPGSGLGLAIVKAIVISHGGTLELANHPSGGAYVTVTLPLAQPN